VPTSIVRALRKIRPAAPGSQGDPHRITVGRSLESDVVIGDETVSKTHAFFQRDPSGPGLALADAGSMNGTWVAGQRLASSGRATPTPPGTRLRFGRVELTLVDSGDFWDRLRQV
jgi:pSer/pThr/pTyr-binding forkhead associated (FHA) protein